MAATTEQVKATPGVRFHEGYCLEMTGRLAAALEAYEASEKMAGEQNKNEVLAAVRARLEPLAQRVPQMILRVAPKDADVLPTEYAYQTDYQWFQTWMTSQIET